MTVIYAWLGGRDGARVVAAGPCRRSKGNFCRGSEWRRKMTSVKDSLADITEITAANCEALNLWH